MVRLVAGPDVAVGLGASYESNAPRCIIYIFKLDWIVQTIKMIWLHHCEKCIVYTNIELAINASWCGA
jgi:hypothetical protein